MACVIVLCGLPGSGKTTLAKQIAAQRGGIRLCPDDWMGALGIDLYDQPARAAIERLQWDLAQELVVTGVNAIVEWGTWARAERDVIRQRCRELGVSVEFHFLDVSIEELWERLSARNRMPGETVIARDDLLRWAALFEAPTDDEIACFDPPTPP